MRGEIEWRNSPIGGQFQAFLLGSARGMAFFVNRRQQHLHVIPAQAGIQFSSLEVWLPLFHGRRWGTIVAVWPPMPGVARRQVTFLVRQEK
jgi:hypothetical protein